MFSKKLLLSDLTGQVHPLIPSLALDKQKGAECNDASLKVFEVKMEEGGEVGSEVE